VQQKLRGAGFLAVAGGLLLALVPLVDEFMPSAELLFWVPPLSLLVAARRVSEQDDASLHAHRALRFGLGALCVAGLVNAVAFLIQGGLAFLGFVGLPAVAGVVLVAVGSAGIARDWWRTGTAPRWLAVLFGVALPLDPLVNGLLAGVVSVGISLYGIAWVALGGVLLARPTALLRGESSLDTTST
jgi:hypothetical protein